MPMGLVGEMARIVFCPGRLDVVGESGPSPWVLNVIFGPVEQRVDKELQ